MIQAIALPALIVIAVVSVALIIISDWRVRLGLLAVLYFGIFIILSINWPVGLAVTKLVAGWMAAAVLGMALLGTSIAPVAPDLAPQHSGNNFISFAQRLRLRPVTLFYLIAAILVSLFTISVSTLLRTWIPTIQNEVIWAGMILLGMGILQLGFRDDAFSTTIGLLTIVSGFEIFFASVERSTLVAGLLAGITLGLALVGAYLISAPQLEEEE